MHVYIAVYSYTNLYIQPKCTQEVSAVYLQGIHTQEAGAHYTKLTQL